MLKAVLEIAFSMSCLVISGLPFNNVSLLGLLKLVGTLLGAAAAGIAGKKALEKRKKKVDKKRMGGLKSELNNPARGYTKGGIARGGGAAIKGTDFKGVF